MILDFDIDMDWLYCQDGAELIEYEIPDKKDLDDRMGRWGVPSDDPTIELILSRAAGKQIRYKSESLKIRRIKAINYRDAVVIKFANATSDEGLVKFISEYGFPQQPRLQGLDSSEVNEQFKERYKGEFSDTGLLRFYEKVGTPVSRIREMQTSISKLVRSTSLKKFSEQFFIDVEMTLPIPKRGEPPRLLVVPPTLIDFMELEAALLVIRKVEKKTCPICGNVFIKGGEQAKRAHSKYCSSNCRLKAYRKRKTAAKRRKK